MYKSSKKSILILLAVLISLQINACGPNRADLTPTINVADLQTSAVSTFAAGLTQTAFSIPTNTPQPTNTLSPTDTPVPTKIVGPPTPTALCYGLVYIKDVTIKDGTAMTPGETFTKTWQVQNTGTCAWDVGFKFALVGGDAMGGVTLTLTKVIGPGDQVELSIPMTAPNKTGTVTGTWRMSTINGTYFGDTLTVVINIGTLTATATATGATPTSSETPTPTP